MKINTSKWKSFLKSLATSSQSQEFSKMLPEQEELIVRYLLKGEMISKPKEISEGNQLNYLKNIQ